MQLLAMGLGIGLISVFFPHLQLGQRFLAFKESLPLLGTSISLDAAWHRYQSFTSTVPIVGNHDPFADKLPAAERRMRMGSKIDKETIEAVGGRDYTRVESAGPENMLGHELPVYYIERAPTTVPVDSESTLAKSWLKIGNEITGAVRPNTIVILSPLRSKADSIMINVSPLAQPLYSHATSKSPYQPGFDTRGSPSVANTLLELLATSPPIDAKAWERGLEPTSWATLVALFGPGLKANVVQVTIPTGWSSVTNADELLRFGSRLREIRDDGIVIL